MLKLELVTQTITVPLEMTGVMVDAFGITRAGFENNVEVCVRYLAAWLDGNGCVPINWLSRGSLLKLSQLSVLSRLITLDWQYRLKKPDA